MRKFVITFALLAACTSIGRAQTFGSSGTATLSVSIPAEAAISIDAASNPTSLATTGTSFANPFTGTTNFHYKIRTTKSGGTGNVQLYVSTDFACSGGSPCIATPPSGGDALTYA